MQRAILDVLQQSDDLPRVREILSTPTSIGGIPGRGTAHAIDLIENARRAGNANFVAGSDISGFFTQIDQAAVVRFIREQTDDDDFVDLFSRALRVELANASEMDPEELKLFPTDSVGVAQGCPLSALAGNIVLRDFDSSLNGRNITCIRYIDDFMLLGRRESSVKKAFENASNQLAALSMAVYHPATRPDKAFQGKLGDNFDFLGYQIVPGSYPPAKKNRDQVLDSVRQELDCGRSHILKILRVGSEGKPLQCYAQTLDAVDALLRAWSGSFSASRSLTVARELDDAVNAMISDFIAFYRQKTNGRTLIEKRRALGVHLIEDDVNWRVGS